MMKKNAYSVTDKIKICISGLMTAGSLIMMIISLLRGFNSFSHASLLITSVLVLISSSLSLYRALRQSELWWSRLPSQKKHEIHSAATDHPVPPSEPDLKRSYKSQKRIYSVFHPFCSTRQYFPGALLRLKITCISLILL